MRAIFTVITGLTILAFNSGNTGLAADKLLFERVPNFLQVPDDIQLGMCSAVAVDRQGQVYLLHRSKQPILCFDAQGKFLRSWGDEYFAKPHGLRIDRDDNVWATDTVHHLVLKFSSKGKLLLALGQPDRPGTGPDQFNKPSDIAFGPKGEIYVSDGYGNSRVMQFNAQGKLENSWGKPGKGPGEFNLPHSILVDSKGRVLVGDRENQRIQIFDGQGKLLEIWPGFRPYGLVEDFEGNVFVADAIAKNVVRLNSAGKIAQSWDYLGPAPESVGSPHMLATDAKGNLYITVEETLLKMTRK